MRRTPVTIFGGLVVACVLLASDAFAHEWYPPYCCTGVDCAPIAGERVKATPEGFIVDGLYSVPRAEVKDSMDGRYHGCFPEPDKLRCFFAPPPGS